MVKTENQTKKKTKKQKQKNKLHKVLQKFVQWNKQKSLMEQMEKTFLLLQMAEFIQEKEVFECEWRYCSR